MSIHIEIYGQGQPLVLVHGWAMHSGVWRQFAQQLAAHCQVICVDLPGHGRSEPLPEFVLPTVCDALLQAIPVEQFSLLGWSMGASVAIAMAKRAPQRVTSLQLLAGNPHFLAEGDWPGVMPKVLDNFAAQIQGDINQMLGRFLALQVNGLPNGRALLVELKAALALDAQPDTGNLRGGLQLLQQADLREDLLALHCPVTVIQGDRDPLIPVATLSAIRTLKSAVNAYLLSGAGHVPFLTHADQLRGIIVRALPFISRVTNKKRLIRQAFAHAAASYDQVADLQRQVALTLLAHFPLQSHSGWIMDLGCGTGFLGRKMARHESSQPLCAVDLALPMLSVCAQQADIQPFLVAGDAEYLPFAGQQFQQIYSSLALQWCQDLSRALAESQRVLVSGGRIVFSTLTDGTLCELKQAWSGVDGYAHVNRFLSVADIQAILAAQGWQNIQCHCQAITLYYPDAVQLMRELKQLGAHFVQSNRKHQLTTRTQLQQVLNQYPRDAQGRIPATYQVLYVSADALE